MPNQYRLVDTASLPEYRTAWHDDPTWPLERARTLREEYCGTVDEKIFVEARRVP